MASKKKSSSRAKKSASGTKKPATAPSPMPSPAPSATESKVEPKPVAPRVEPALELVPTEKEPSISGRDRTPMWLIALVGLVVLWGDYYLIKHGGGFHAKVYAPFKSIAEVNAIGPKSPEEIMFAKGRVVYNSNCSVCHQPSGQGTPVFPPLAGSDWVNGVGPNRMIRIVLFGFQGPVEVNGSQYNGVMPPLASALDDEDIAAVLTYVRTNEDWGNTASAVTPEEVAEVRAATSGRGAMNSFTAEELLQIPHGGTGSGEEGEGEGEGQNKGDNAE